MTNRSCETADRSAPPTVVVRLFDAGNIRMFKRVSASNAEMLVKRGWGEWVGTGRRRYVRLTESAPVSALTGWRGKDGTRPMRGDGSGDYGDGQLLGEPRSHREHIPTE